MNRAMVLRDFKRNRILNLTLLLFMTLATTLAVLSMLTATQTFTAISRFYQAAEPPHFLQMHKGDIDEAEIDRFMAHNEQVTHHQTIKMLNIYGRDISVHRNGTSFNLSDNRLGISLVKQNFYKDLLLDNQHSIVTLQPGEIGMPVLLTEQYNLQVGDTIILQQNDHTYEFVMTEVILDAQMNSPMVSSTRILLNDQDFNQIQTTMGEPEYLIEAYFRDSNEAKAFQTAYENAGLPQNGQAVTYTIIFLLSALTDITTVFVLLLVSVLLIVIAFICVRFTILATLEEEIQEIGTMKAIGLPFNEIRNLYLYKYRLLAMVSAVLGFLLALLASKLVTQHISATFGNLPLTLLAIASSAVIAGLVFLFIQFYCRKTLNKLKKVTVIDALVARKGFGQERGVAQSGLTRSRHLSMEWWLSLREVFYKFANWVIVFGVVFLSFVMILIPLNLLLTFESPTFITYMGSSLEDILIQVENGVNLENNYTNTKQLLDTNETVKQYYESRNVRVQTLDRDAQWINLELDSGANAGDGLQYLSGQSPQLDNEVALSMLNADELGKETGDTFTLHFADIEREFIISGIYQDVTSGGFTAKTKASFPELEASQYAFSVNLTDASRVETTADEWAEQLGGGVSVAPMAAFIDQTLGGIAQQLRSITFAVAAVGAGITILITTLFLKLRLAKDQSAIAILKAIGFTEKDIVKQYMIKMGLISLGGILLGMLLTDFLGEKVVNMGLSIAGLGIREVKLIHQPWLQYFLIPILLLLLVAGVTWWVTTTHEKKSIVAFINE